LSERNAKTLEEYLGFDPVAAVKQNESPPRRLFPDGREATVVKMMFTARLTIGLPGEMYYDDGWCYETVADATVAMFAWDPEKNEEPAGWHRHPTSGRRRPDGDPTKEYVNQ